MLEMWILVWLFGVSKDCLTLASAIPPHQVSSTEQPNPF